MERPPPHQEPYVACETAEPAFKNDFTVVFSEGIYNKTMWVSEWHVQGIPSLCAGQGRPECAVR